MQNGTTTGKPDLEAVTDDRRVRLLHQVHILYNLLPTTQWIHLAAILVVFGLLLRHVGFFLLSSWLVFVFLILLSRILITKYYKSSTKTLENADYWFNWFLVGTTLYGIMWSATAILLVPAGDPFIVGFTALILSGLAAGGVAVASVSAKVFLVYAISTTWPYSAYLISSGQEPHATIGLLVLGFFFLIAILAYHINSFFTNLIDLQLKTYILEREVKQESEKRRFIEKALLDNTMEEGVADLIRQYSRVLKEKQELLSSPEYNEEADNNKVETRKLVHYIELLNEAILRNVTSALVFLNNVEGSILNESQKKNIQIVEKILQEAKAAIERSFGGNERESFLDKIGETRDIDEKINLRRFFIYITHEIPLLYKAKYITIRRKIDRSVPQEVYGNKPILEQIFRQLLINAFKHSDGGTININVDNAGDDGDRIRLHFEISDTGVGIPNDIVEKLRQDMPSEEISDGLGTVKQLVDRLGGEFSIQSTLGVGSTVTVNLSFNKVPEATLSEHDLSA